MFVINAGSKETMLCVLSYNSRGFGALKQDFCNHLSSRAIVGNKIPVLCNQEHFVLRGNSYKLRQALPNSHLIINPAEKASHQKGRAKGGMFIAVPDTFKNNIQDVSPSFWRLQAALIKTQGSIILLINSYFPVDTRAANSKLSSVKSSNTSETSFKLISSLLYVSVETSTVTFLEKLVMSMQYKAFSMTMLCSKLGMILLLTLLIVKKSRVSTTHQLLIISFGIWSLLNKLWILESFIQLTTVLIIVQFIV